MNKWSEFTSQVSSARAAAGRAGADFELITNVAPPVDVINWASKRNIVIRMYE